MLNHVRKRASGPIAICTWALNADPEADGAAAIFDQALSNGLAAIVAERWPGTVHLEDGKVRSASQLLDVIKARGTALSDGVWALPHGEPGELWVEGPSIGVGPGPERFPNFTEVQVSTLREAIRRTQALRHARESASPDPLTSDHIAALKALDHDPALFALSQETIDRAEQGADREAREEFDRARFYWQMLDEEERIRRGELDYSQYGAFDPGDYTPEIQHCPVCGLNAFVADSLDSYVGDVGIGACVACSFRRSEAVADSEGLDQALARVTER